MSKPKVKDRIVGASGLTIRPGAWGHVGIKTGTPMPVRCPICRSNKIVMSDYPGERDIECEGCNSVIAYVNPKEEESDE